MTKHNVLTEEEFLQFHPNLQTIKFLEKYRKKTKLNRNEISVLDWGCGRGREVLWLREQGYNAFGVGIDPEPIRNGMNLISKKGYDDSLLNLINLNGKTKFPNEFFHFVFSNSVFEHVSDLEAVVVELHRVTIKNGIGFHSFPARRSFKEGHLHMPLIHWVPKNYIRKFFIFLYVCLHREPRWKGLKDCNNSEKTERYFRYSLEKTFYRRYSKVRKIFEENGFKVYYTTIDYSQQKRSKLIKMLKPIYNRLLLTFHFINLYTINL